MAKTLKFNISFDATVVASSAEITEAVAYSKRALQEVAKSDKVLTGEQKHALTLCQRVVAAHEADDQEALEAVLVDMFKSTWRKGVADLVKAELGRDGGIRLSPVTIKEIK